MLNEADLLQKRVVNDFVIPNKNPQTAEQHRGRHFQIQFDLQSYNYFIKDLGVGYGVFVRQEDAIVRHRTITNYLIGAERQHADQRWRGLHRGEHHH